jgi:DHA1 family inner membrane transport protein
MRLSMGFFVNRKFNLVYLHVAMQAFAMHGGEAFVFIYLLKEGIPAPVVLFCIGAMFASRLFFRNLIFPLVRQFGLKHTLILSVLVEASTYPILSQINSTGPLLVAYLTLWAISSSIYWTSYHTYVALLGDNEHRGKQVSAIEFVAMATNIAAPALSAVLLLAFGPVVTFGFVGLIMACAAIPIWLGPELTVSSDAEVPPAARKLARLIMFTDGLRSGSFHFTWVIALFITLGSSYAAFGGAMSLAGVVGAVAGLFIGRAFDLGNVKRATQIGCAALAVASAARTFGYSIPLTAVIANAAATIAWPIYNTALSARVYILAKQSLSPLRYHVVAEGGWDMGTATACFISALLIHLGFGYGPALGVSLIACASAYFVLSRMPEHTQT